MSGGESKKKEKERKEGRRDILRALTLCILAVVVVRSFIFEPFKIPSSSMVPTLKIGDHIFVSKFNYGLSFPFTKWQLLRTGSPKRGEIVVFLFPKDESLHYVKRVIGIPGDKIKFEGKDLFINGELVKKERVEDPAEVTRLTGIEDFKGHLYRETIEGVTHLVQYKKEKETSLSRLSQETTVPEGKFFVVGDNRDDSYDSRSWGMVSAENIKGKAQFIWLSIDQDEGWNSLGKIRWDRCGQGIR